MTIRNKGLSNFSANFEPNIAAPLDARTLVSNKADLILASTWLSNDGSPYTYIGMLVSVASDPTVSNRGIYQLQGADYTDINNWILAAVGAHNLLSNLPFTESGHTGFQEELSSGVNIKTLNGESLLGSGNIVVNVDLSNYYTKSDVYTKTEINTMVGDIEAVLDAILGFK